MAWLQMQKNQIMHFNVLFYKGEEFNLEKLMYVE